MHTDTERRGEKPDVALGLKLLNHHVASHNFIKSWTGGIFSKATYRKLVMINKDREWEWKIPPPGFSVTKTFRENERKGDSLIFPGLFINTNSKSPERLCFFFPMASGQLHKIYMQTSFRAAELCTQIYSQTAVVLASQWWSEPLLRTHSQYKRTCRQLQREQLTPVVAYATDGQIL